MISIYPATVGTFTVKIRTLRLLQLYEPSEDPAVKHCLKLKRFKLIKVYPQPSYRNSVEELLEKPKHIDCPVTLYSYKSLSVCHSNKLALEYTRGYTIFLECFTFLVWLWLCVIINNN